MKQFRLASIDVLRAVTMLLMIWVNDFWTLTDIPKWLKHASATEDYLGFSDVIFPLFLFLVGLSIPYAIKQRKKKGATTFSMAKHIVIRSASLIIIGVYMVNYETAHHESVIIGKYFWEILMAISVVLIWMNWSKSPVSKKWHLIFQLSGWGILLFLAIIYKGGENGEGWMTTQWWGILGLIGWAYLLNGLVFLFSKGRMGIIIGVYILLNTMVVLDHADLLPGLKGPLKFLGVLYAGNVPVFTTAGILTSLMFRKLSENHSKWKFTVLILFGVLSIVYGLLLRPYWGISKIQGTPSWVGICIGVSVISFVLFNYLCDVQKKTNWAKIIAPAGTATLTCYMVPYFVYPIAALTGFKLPSVLNSGIIGLLGSFVFALVVVVFVGRLQKKGFSLKL